jgi:shikimate dehydrogenase
VRISGKTKITGIIGYPLTYTISPAIHNRAFEKLGLDICYIPLVVEPKNLVKAVLGLKALNFIGFNVTMPHKETILPLLDELSEEVRLIQAINTVVVKDNKLFGHNTDGQGFLSSLREIRIDSVGKKIVIIGAGGAARAVTVALAREGAAAIYIVNRTLERAENLRELLKKNFPHVYAKTLQFTEQLADIIKRADIVINATPIGMQEGEKPPIPVDSLHERQVVCDLIYKPAETELLKISREKGAVTLGGLKMLVYQAALAFELWTKQRAPVEVMWEEAVAQIDGCA